MNLSLLCAYCGCWTVRSMMTGIPDWLRYTVGLAILFLSSGLLAWLIRRRSAATNPGWRWDLLRIGWFRRLLAQRWFQFSVQVPAVALFLLVIGAGLFGNQVFDHNIAPLLTWTIWWGFLIFAILFLGKIWCLVCPWNAVSDWIARLAFWKRKASAFSLNLRVPRAWRNIYLATGFFLILTWLEMGYAITLSPRWAAVLGLLMVAFTLIPVLLFEHQAFCRYGCPVGRVSGMYAMFAPLELRSRKREICRSCQTNDCYYGNEKGYPCPTSQYLGTMESNTYCILCTECVKSCPKDNVAFNLRPFAADLIRLGNVRKDEAYLILAMLSMTLFQGLTKTPAWSQMVESLQNMLSVDYLAAFSVAMGAMLLVPGLLYTALVYGMRCWIRLGDLSLKRIFLTYTYPVLPIALFYHLALNTDHVLMRVQKILVLASDPFGWGWDLFGTASRLGLPFLPMPVVWAIQVGAIMVAQLASVYVVHRISRQLISDPVRARRTQVIFTIWLILLGWLCLWLLK